VYFLNASTEEILKADFETLIRSRGAEHRSKSYEEALRWLENQIEGWLMILDNADNPKFRLFPHFPKCVHGNIIITTRNSNHATLAPNSTHHLEGLSTEDAVLLILTASGNEINDANKAIAHRIVDELGHLPLALAQAAGYTFVNKCLETYLDIYRESKGKLLAITSSELPSDYPTSVATTIQMSLERLSAEAQNVMRLFAHLDSTSIANEIISKAAKRHFKTVVKTEEPKVDLQTLHQAETLMNIFCAGGEWSEVHFNELVTQCLQYSLLRLTTRGGSKFYSMHILVQSYLRSISDPVDDFQPGSLVVRILGSSITYDANFGQLTFNRLVIPHIRLICIEDVVEAGDHLGFGNVLDRNGNGRLSTVHLERCVELWKASLGEEHLNTLKAMLYLANSYGAMGKNQKALELYEPLLHVQERVLGPEDIDTLKTMGNIGMTYSQLGRHQDALKLQEQVLEITKRVFGPEHRDTVDAMGGLAISYDEVGRHKDALELKEKALELQTKMLGEDDPDRLKTMHNISTCYWMMGRHKDAMELIQVVLEKQTRVLGIEHPDTLLTSRNLLRRLKYFGMTDRLRELLLVTLPAHERSLGADHPDTIWLRDRFGYLVADSEGEDISPAAVSTLSSQQLIREREESESSSTVRAFSSYVLVALIF
jgi:tetratricopeptide (TPR) repeat protein